MKDVDRLLLECRYILSINKSIGDIAKHLGVDEKIVYNDIYNWLPKFDQILNNRVKKIIKNI